MTKPPRTKRAEDARARILEVAERLFALHGIDAVSMRQINEAASQKNGSAIHYHFGSRDGLIDAIFDLRVTGTDALRRQYLDQVKEEAGENLPTLRDIASAIVLPTFVELKPGAKTYHRRFVKQIHMQHHLMDRFLSKRYDFGLRECFRLIRWIRPDIPAPVQYHRYIHASAISVDAAANLEERNDLDPKSVTQDWIDLHVACCIDSIAGVFAAPVSDAAIKLSGDKERSSTTLDQLRAHGPM
ncbi:TetR/AcrR family transcriptional regulator [Pacificispira sp.]|uniref:TetR/AcrR family transcriptional regulator n=1 Tax=Pacificispira sp. TaxID=2888761 RepID=UPI003B516E89